MIETIKIGEKNVKLNANGATPYWYTQIFHNDFYRDLDAVAEGAADKTGVSVWSQCAFVMAMQAAKGGMDEYNEKAYAEWLAKFGPADLANAVGDVIDVWNKASTPTSEPKK